MTKSLPIPFEIRDSEEGQTIPLKVFIEHDLMTGSYLVLQTPKKIFMAHVADILLEVIEASKEEQNNEVDC